MLVSACSVSRRFQKALERMFPERKCQVYTLVLEASLDYDILLMCLYDQLPERCTVQNVDMSMICSEIRGCHDGIACCLRRPRRKWLIRHDSGPYHLQLQHESDHLVMMVALPSTSRHVGWRKLITAHLARTV